MSTVQKTFKKKKKHQGHSTWGDTHQIGEEGFGHPALESTLAPNARGLSPISPYSPEGRLATIEREVKTAI